MITVKDLGKNKFLIENIIKKARPIITNSQTIFGIVYLYIYSK